MEPVAGSRGAAHCREAACGAVYHSRCLRRWQESTAQQQQRRARHPPPPPGRAQCVLCTQYSVPLRAARQQTVPVQVRSSLPREPLGFPDADQIYQMLRRDRDFHLLSSSVRMDLVENIVRSPDFGVWDERQRARLMHRVLMAR